MMTLLKELIIHLLDEVRKTGTSSNLTIQDNNFFFAFELQINNRLKEKQELKFRIECQNNTSGDIEKAFRRQIKILEAFRKK